MSVAILIPAYEPGTKLIEVIKGLSDSLAGPVIIVDDGGGERFASIFDECRKLANVSVIANAINLGKGASLKNGINYILTHMPDVAGIVTADADGQHAVKDILAVCEEVKDNEGAFVLGARDFDDGVPFRSKFGNGISRLMYRLLLGLKLRDTQTGLRGLPIQLAKASLKIRSNRYEFETEQLSLAAAEQIPIREVTIETIYEDNNSSSHFNPLFDSAKIYFVVFRYALSSLATTIVDFAAFLILMPFLPGVIAANLASRAIALGVQFFLLRTFVFHSRGGLAKLLFFIGYVALTGIVSGVLQAELSNLTGLSPIAAKVVVELMIFIFNFLFLRNIVFNKRPA